MALRPPGNLTVTSAMLVWTVRAVPMLGHLEAAMAGDGIGPRVKALERARNKSKSINRRGRAMS